MIRIISLFLCVLVHSSSLWALPDSANAPSDGDSPCAPSPCKTTVLPGQEANAGCLVVQHGRVLVVKQRYSGKLSLPGGSANKGESPACTAARETSEETGLEVTVGELLEQAPNGFMIFRCFGRSVDGPTPADWLEVEQALWLPVEEIEKQRWRFPERVEPLQRLIDNLD